MKKIWTICAAVFCCLQLNAWGQGVDFQDLTFQQALDKAKAEGKLVFMDCYTSWCGPCKHMTENVFLMAVMGEYFNKTFVNVKFDMEKGEGAVLRRKFLVNSYPTFFILRPDGTVQHKISGARPQERFLECAKRGANEKTSLSYLQKVYNEGKATPEQVEAYRTALSDAGDRGRLYQITERDFKGMNDEQRCAAENWYIYDQELVGIQTEQFAYILDHKAAFDKNVGKKKVDAKLADTYETQLMVLKGKAEKGQDISATINLIKEQLGKADFAGKDRTEALIRYIETRQGKDIDALLTFLEKDMDKLPKGCLFEMPFFEFVIKDGTPEQAERYLALEDRIIKLSDTPQMTKIVQTTFAKYREEAKK